MPIQTALEQLALELINRARLDPAAEAARFGITVNEGLAAGTITSTAKQPLAMNDKLITAARGHSQAMLDHDFSGHDNPVTDSTAISRANAAGYSSTFVGENIGRSVGLDAFTPAELNAAVLAQHEFLFVDPTIPGRGHRINMLLEDYKEFGDGLKTGLQNLPGGNPSDQHVALQTHDYGLDDAVRFLTGVVYNDTVVNDDFYSVGEGRTGVTVAAGASTTTGVAGGYSRATGSGVQSVTFSGGGLASPTTVTLAAGTANVKLDLVDGNTVFSSGSLTLVSGATKATLLGIATLTATGSAAANILTGNRGTNTLDGKAGNDTLDGGVGNDTLIGGTGLDALNGGVGTDIADYRTKTAPVEVVLAGATVKTVKVGGVSEDTVRNVEIVYGGSGADKLTGDGLSNTLFGYSGNDILVGGAGNDVLAGLLGNDVMNGSAGNDFFRFNAALGPTNIDVINSFIAANDTIQIENAIFTAIGQTSGTLTAAKYHEGTGAHDPTDRIIYNNANGHLIYDSDGSGPAVAKQFGRLAPGLAASLSNADFVVI